LIPPLRGRFRAAVFDMDGLLLDSEPYWKRAEREVFSTVGIDITEEMSRVTAAMTTGEVTAHWFRFRPWPDRTLREVEQAVIRRVADMIASDGAVLPGVREMLDTCRAMGWKVALVSNSPLVLCELAVRSLGIENMFDELISSEHVTRGKPAPDIYRHAALQLDVATTDCIAFEDSVGGVQAARAAGVAVVAVPSTGQCFTSSDHAPDLIAPSLLWFRERYFADSMAQSAMEPG